MTRKAALAAIDPANEPYESAVPLTLNEEDRAAIVLALTIAAWDAEADAVSAIACQQWRLAESFKRTAMARQGLARAVESATQIRG